MTNTHPRRSMASLALMSGVLLALAVWLTVEARQAAALVAASAGVPSVRALDPPALLHALKLNQELVHALPMLTVVAMASVLVFLALLATVWRRLRRPAAAAPSASAAAQADPAADTAPAATGMGFAAAALPGAATEHSPALLPLRTGLLTRDQFLAHHHAAVAQAAQHKQRVAVLCFDIERLSSINATLGFDAGDEAIAQTAHRARTELATGGTLAQLGGGTMAALVRMEGTQTALQRAQTLRVALQQTRHWRGQHLELAVSVGCAGSPEHGETTAHLLRRAEQALYEAQRVGAAVAAYHPAIEAARLAHLSMATGLHEALLRNELVPYLQPRWCTRTRSVSGAEVLARWLHPVRGCLLPAEFLPFAQNNGLMARITQHLLLTTARLQQDELPSHPLWVNLSAADLREPSLVPLLQERLRTPGLLPHHLGLEVSEQTLLAGGADALARLAELRQLGVGVAIDDFGTGPSPLAQLQQLPVSELKLHRSYTLDVDSNPGRQQLLKTMIEMAHNLNLTITAKGVETADERGVLEGLGCDFLQGYLLGRPMPVADFLAFVRAPAATAETTATAPATAH